MNESFNCKSIEGVFKQIGEFLQQQREEKERTLAEIITKYDFIVGSKECKCKLMEVLPEGANIICSPYFEDPTIIYAIKKFDIMDLLLEPQESPKEQEPKTGHWEWVKYKDYSILGDWGLFEMQKCCCGVCSQR